MDALQALAVTCKHLHQELPATLPRLQKQKAAAHTRVYRLRARLVALELTNKLLLAMWLAARRHNDVIRSELERYVRELKAQLSDGEKDDDG